MALDTCALRRAVPADAPAIEAFLARHAETSMFLRSNLATNGIGASAERTATDFIVVDVDGTITGVFGLTRAGYLLVQSPDAVQGLAALRTFWAGRHVLGLTGVPAQVDMLLTALGLEGAPVALDDDEPLYRLQLSRMEGPDIEVRAPVTADWPMLVGWFDAYGAETGTAFSKDEAEDRATRAIKRDNVRLLEHAGVPVAMTAFNAQVADMVQIGGVFVPPDLRGRGFGRRVVLGHLQQARTRGINQAILFAANIAAAKAYEAIGFAHIGSYSVVMFDPPAKI